MARRAGMTRAEWIAPRRLLGRSGAPARARLRALPLLPAAQPGARRPRHARLHVRAAPRLRRRPHRGDRQHDAQAAAGREAPARRRASSSRSATRRSSSRSPPASRSPRTRSTRGSRRFQAYGSTIGASVSGIVPHADRSAQPPRPARGGRRLPPDEARQLRRAGARARARRTRGSSSRFLLKRVGEPDRRELEDVPARRPVRARLRHGDRDRRCSRSPPASRRTTSRSSR